MRAVAYLRVSSDDQAASGLGMEAQEHSCSQCAGRESLPVVGPFRDDGVSGAAPLDKRPGLLAAVAALEPGDVLVVAKRDRLGRDPIAVAMIESAVARKKCRIVSAAGEGTDNDDPSSVLMRRMVDAFAEYERLLIKSRTKSALDAKRRRGDRCGQIAFGTTVVDDGRRSKKGNLPVALTPEPAEVAALATIRELADAGLSLRRIAARLDGMGVRPKNGGPKWSHQSIRLILNRNA